MKKVVYLFLLLTLVMASCKTTKSVVVKEEAVTVLNAGQNDVAYKYYVIIGSFKEKANSETFVKSLAGTGLNTPTILKSEVGFFRVSIFSSDSERQAREKINSIRSYYPEYKHVWLLIAK